MLRILAKNEDGTLKRDKAGNVVPLSLKEQEKLCKETQQNVGRSPKEADGGRPAAKAASK